MEESKALLNPSSIPPPQPQDHGFRYVQMQFSADVKLQSIEQIHFRTDNTLTTNFSSSSQVEWTWWSGLKCILMLCWRITINQVINTIHYGAYMGQGSNMMSVPTDCDQRDEYVVW